MEDCVCCIALVFNFSKLCAILFQVMIVVEIGISNQNKNRLDWTTDAMVADSKPLLTSS